MRTMQKVIEIIAGELFPPLHPSGGKDPPPSHRCPERRQEVCRAPQLDPGDVEGLLGHQDSPTPVPLPGLSAVHI